MTGGMTGRQGSAAGGDFPRSRYEPKEADISITLLIMMGVALLAGGVGMTFMLASAIPEAVLQHAQDHGRYAGLTGSDQGGSTGKPVATGSRHLRPQGA